MSVPENASGGAPAGHQDSHRVILSDCVDPRHDIAGKSMTDGAQDADTDDLLAVVDSSAQRSQR